MRVLLDLNNRTFQADWFALEKDDRAAVLQTCMKLAAMDWNDVYSHKGLRWEAIKSRTAKDDSHLYTIRITQRIRATVRREDNYLEFLSLHSDHDSAYH